MISRRLILTGLLGLVAEHPGGAWAFAGSGEDAFADIPIERHERSMRQAIAAARLNPSAPFGAVIARLSDGEILAEGVNSSGRNPILHGEIAAMNNYVRRHGNREWQTTILYTTAEPCPMCMSAIVWAGIGGVVFGTSIEGLKRAGFDQIDIASAAVAGASRFWHGQVRGGVLASETDKLFMERTR
ncbi:nucleoside deaminase [Occallatibacter riparius]|uniref:Nucleoside deaminase n=1 Tax=Occallatibacter riparius TaxID=1002689 RepID=A0A9J7BMG0_9BACT|nr:nucleoside deaminase [Occallatibacter riparius]UWZ82946.1 nucleoside deaminase [Occallatibacter riparius]